MQNSPANIMPISKIQGKQIGRSAVGYSTSHRRNTQKCEVDEEEYNSDELF